MNERMRVALLLAVSMLVYANTLRNALVFDDKAYILQNPAVTNTSLPNLFAANKDSNIFRPVAFATLALNWKLGADQPFGYHLGNLLLHAGVTLLLYLTLRKLLEAVLGAESIAFAAALLFAVHPIHTEAVAWSSARSELLAAGFLLAAWLLHLRDRPIPSLLCFVLALLSKESAMAFVLLVLTGDYIRGNFKRAWNYIAMVVVAVAYVPLLWTVQGGRLGEISINFADNPLASLPPVWRILNALRVAWKYVGLQIYPATLSCDYSYNAILVYVNWRHTLLPAIGAALVLAAWFWAVWKKKSEWALAGAIYFAGFAVTANVLLATGTIMAERLAYFPSAGFCLLLALLWKRLEVHRRGLAWGLLLVVVAALGVRTVVRNRDWRTNLALFSAAVQAVPGSARMHGNLGSMYLYAGQLQAARVELETSLRIYPDLPKTVGMYGLLESRLGKDEDALRDMQKAVAMSSRSDFDYDFLSVNLAAQLMKLGRNDEALKILNEQVVASSGYSRAWSNRAVIRYQRRDFSGARSDVETALRLDPSNTQARSLLGALNSPAASSDR